MTDWRPTAISGAFIKLATVVSLAATLNACGEAGPESASDVSATGDDQSIPTRRGERSYTDPSETNATNGETSDQSVVDQAAPVPSLPAPAPTPAPVPTPTQAPTPKPAPAPAPTS